jgi:hypothetical protein
MKRLLRILLRALVMPIAALALPIYGAILVIAWVFDSEDLREALYDSLYSMWRALLSTK